jgi:hypothetical protein
MTGLFRGRRRLLTTSRRLRRRKNDGTFSREEAHKEGGGLKMRRTLGQGCVFVICFLYSHSWL